MTVQLHLPASELQKKLKKRNLDVRFEALVIIISDLLTINSINYNLQTKWYLIGNWYNIVT